MMTTNPIVVDELVIHVLFKNIRHIYLRVNTSDGSIRLSAPHQTSPERIRLLLELRANWIRKQLARMPTTRASQIPDGFVQHLGEIVPVTSLCGNVPELGRLAVLQNLRRRVLHELLTAYMREWESRLALHAESWHVRRMKSRWGSCHVQKKRLCFNTELVYQAPECIEYVVVHELLHLRERGHGKAFWALVAQALPDWKQRRARLRAG